MRMFFERHFFLTQVVWCGLAAAALYMLKFHTPIFAWYTQDQWLQGGIGTIVVTSVLLLPLRLRWLMGATMSVATLILCFVISWPLPVWLLGVALMVWALAGEMIWHVKSGFRGHGFGLKQSVRLRMMTVAVFTFVYLLAWGLNWVTEAGGQDAWGGFLLVYSIIGLGLGYMLDLEADDYLKFVPRIVPG